MRNFLRSVRAAPAALLLLFSSPDSTIASVDVEKLYHAEAVITGNLEHEKLRGFAEGLEKVLVKVSGNPDLAGTPEVVALAVRAADFVNSYELVDRMAGIPVRDEQGTRERPHLLSIVFSRQRVDRALQELGYSPWLERPGIDVVIAVDNGTNRFLLGRGSDAGSEHKQSLADIGKELGLSIDYPTKQEIAKAPLNADVLGSATPEQLGSLRGALNAEALLAGTLIWDKQAFRWSSRWQLATGETQEEWENENISFESVFRRTLENTMQALSETGNP